MTDESNSMELSGTAPDPTPEKPEVKVAIPAEIKAAEEAADTAAADVGIVQEPTGDAPESSGETGLSQLFRFNVAQLLRNIGPVEQVLNDACAENRITGKMRDHLKREALKFVAREICELTTEEIRRAK